MSLQAKSEVEVGLHFSDTKLEVLQFQESLSAGGSNVISKTFSTQEYVPLDAHKPDETKVEQRNKGKYL